MRVIINNMESYDSEKISAMIDDMLKNEHKDCVYTFRDDSTFYVKKTKTGLSIFKEAQPSETTLQKT